jgi:colicin import membrane protein
VFGIGGFELAIIVLFAFLIFGPDKLPKMARSIGQIIRQLRGLKDQADQVIKAEVYEPLQNIQESVAPLTKDPLNLAGILGDKTGSPAKTAVASAAGAAAGAAGAAGAGTTSTGTAAGVGAATGAGTAAGATTSAAAGAGTAATTDTTASTVANTATVSAATDAAAKTAQATPVAAAATATDSNELPAVPATEIPKPQGGKTVESFAQRKARLERRYEKAKANASDDSSKPSTGAGD